MLVPGHIDPEGTALITTDGVTTAFTVIAMVLEVAVVGVAQLNAEVITQETVFPFANAALE